MPRTVKKTVGRGKWDRSKKMRCCVKCKRDKPPTQFKKGDTTGWCRKCRTVTRPAVVAPADGSLLAEVKLSAERALRVRVVGKVLVLTSGRTEKRLVHETALSILGGDHEHGWSLVSMTDSFRDCVALTIPLRFLDKVVDALTLVSKAQMAV